MGKAKDKKKRKKEKKAAQKVMMARVMRAHEAARVLSALFFAAAIHERAPKARAKAGESAVNG
jgi:hypothetical protein